LLTLRGHYVEATTITRHLIEVSAQIRYFAAHRCELLPHLGATTRRNRVSFRTIFDAVMPGYYDSSYRTTSNIAHGGLAMGAFLGYYPEPDDPRRIDGGLRLIAEFDADAGSYVFNHSFVLALAYLNRVGSYFPEYAATVDEETEEMRRSLLTRLREWKEGHRSRFPLSHAWHQLVDSLID